MPDTDTIELAITSQGDTGTASEVTITAPQLKQKGRDLVVRARVCNDGTFANSTNATIAAATGGGSVVATHTSNKDLEFKSQAAVAATETLTLTGVAIDGETVTIGDRVYEFDTDSTFTQGRYPVDISASATASQGTMTLDTQPVAGQAFTIGSTTYTFVATQATALQVAIGATLAATQANIVARVNGTDQFGYSSRNAVASMADFESNTSVITARKPGTAGDSIATTETMADVAQVETITCVADASDSLDATYFQLNDSAGSVGVWIDTDDSGTTIPAGASALDRAIEVTGIATDDTAADVATAVAAAIDGDSEFSASAEGAVVTVTQATAGVVAAGEDGDAGFTFAVTTAGTADGTNGFDAATLGTTTAGVDCTAPNAVTALVAAITADGEAVVTAADGTGDTVDITAKVAGTAANSYATTETMANGSFGAATMSGGIDATPGQVIIALTDATAETVTLRAGASDFGGVLADYELAEIDVTHAAP